MAIQINLPKTANQFGLAFEKAYVRITGANFDFQNKSITFTANVWANQEARDANAQPVTQIPSVHIRSDKTLAQWQNVYENGVLKVDAEGKPEMVQVSPELPSFSDVEQMIAIAIITEAQKPEAERDLKVYHKVGYNLLKLLPLVASNTPTDV